MTRVNRVAIVFTSARVPRAPWAAACAKRSSASAYGALRAIAERLTPAVVPMGTVDGLGAR